MLYGAWPASYNEMVLVLGEDNTLSAKTLYQLGFITVDEYRSIAEQIENGEDAEPLEWDYEDAAGRIFYLVPAADHYAENEDGTFSYIGDSAIEKEQLLENAIELRVSGIVRPKEDAANANVSTALGYTSMLTDYIIDRTDGSAVVMAQERTPEINVINGMAFDAVDDATRVEDAKAYISAMGVSDKASLYQMILYYSSEAEDSAQDDTQIELSEQAQGQIPDGTAQGQMPSGAGQQGQMGVMTMDETALAGMMDTWLTDTPDDEILLSIYEEYIGGGSYADNMDTFGKVSYDAPASISIYTDSFEAKEAVSLCIADYNATVDEDSQITYTDYVELMTSSLTSIVDVISYVLIAFVAVSLIVSCIMIGIITHISVLERTKEIGILRAMGASKRNISQVFNAETFIIGCCSGLLGVGISALLTIPINALLQTLLGSVGLTVGLPFTYAAVLVVLSIVITVAGGLLPAKKAARKDPVAALRAE